MKRFINILGAILLFSAVATASVADKKISTTVNNGGPHCDPIEHLMGACRSVSPDSLFENPEV